MKIGYFDCFSGAAGDMIVGALIDAGCEREFLQSQVDKLKLGDIRLATKVVKKHGLRGTKVEFESKETNPPHRHLGTIEKILNASELETKVAAKAQSIFRRLAEAEAWMHDVPIEEVHFHEVGAIDAICDIVCAVAGLQRLGVDKLFCSKLLLGSGIIESAHGKIPLPAPATMEIARNFPVLRIDNGREMTTPTAAAILVELAEFSPGYDLTVEKIGYGAGTIDLEDRPNLLRFVLGTTTDRLPGDVVTIIETNIDDATPEHIGHLQQRLLDSGALDVFVTSILMKKSRPAHKLTVIAAPDRAQASAQLILQESSTAGVRLRNESRWKLDFQFRTVATEFGEIKIKFYFGGEIRKFSPEYEDVVAAAIKSGTPFVRVYNAAIAAANLLKESDRE